jgi:hypothetical protein
MCHAKLGHAASAKRELEQLRTEMKGWTASPSDDALWLAEADGLVSHR